MQKPPSAANPLALKNSPTSGKGPANSLQIGGKAAAITCGSTLNDPSSARKSKDDPRNVDVSRILVQKMLSQAPAKLQTSLDSSSGEPEESTCSMVDEAVNNHNKVGLNLIDSKVSFTGKVEVHTRPFDFYPPEPEKPEIDVEELLRPVFDELVQSGGTEEEVVKGVSTWLDDYIAQLPPVEKEAVQSHLGNLFHQTQNVLATATVNEKGRYEKLYSNVKDAVEEEVDVMGKRMKGGSFKMNIKRMAEKQGEEAKAKEVEEQMNRLQDMIKGMDAKIEQIIKQHALEIKALEDRHTNDLLNRGDHLGKEVEKLVKEVDMWKNENSRMKQDHANQIRDLASNNESLSKIVIEMRQHAQKRGRSTSDNVSSAEIERLAHAALQHTRNGRTAATSKLSPEKPLKDLKHRSASSSRPDNDDADIPPPPMSMSTHKTPHSNPRPHQPQTLPHLKAPPPSRRTEAGRSHATEARNGHLLPQLNVHRPISPHPAPAIQKVQ
mmetsp:Transcript_15166/g.25993  ORF Transcript_15166/g.25993 Transcript_15166/m.25993 type:complete len:494 (-) Transcript_15166:604-2085(-)|eukprot:CAMPEP_0196658790 /NCGR_PEP_ID=MMETSP1086-20130531/31578_1 /TAXON_ID=77921 /ORGANISM="Cyanoptyche  gloeocystis , Strain SAG4.97" /LENGTH=493 /DNA_ID=CAMNT_0041992525 /DNA_START=93 /DNA_END=1574 /DNA_ORIENTATION=-